MKYGNSVDRNPRERGTIFAPFDQEFCLGLGLRAGGVAAFPDKDQVTNYPADKPWINRSDNFDQIRKSFRDFMDKLADWKPTWIEDELDFVIDYVRITAL